MQRRWFSSWAHPGDVGGGRRWTRRKPTQTWGERANSLEAVTWLGVDLFPPHHYNETKWHGTMLLEDLEARKGKEINSLPKTTLHAAGILAQGDSDGASGLLDSTINPCHLCHRVCGHLLQ